MGRGIISRAADGNTMKDMQAQLERVRADAVECSFIRDQTTDPSKRELFARLALHLETLAIEVERAKAAAGYSSDKMRLLFRTRANAIQPKTRERQSSPSMPSRQRRQIRRTSDHPVPQRDAGITVRVIRLRLAHGTVCQTRSQMFTARRNTASG